MFQEYASSNMRFTLLAFALSGGWVAALAPEGRKVSLQDALKGANKPGYVVAEPVRPPASSGKWRVTLDLGREPGTKMPTDWAASGDRLRLTVDLDARSTPAAAPDAEPLIGKSTLAIEPLGAAMRYTGDDGDVRTASVGGGGWSVRDDASPKKMRFCLALAEAASARGVEVVCDLATARRVRTLGWRSHQRAAAEPASRRLLHSDE